MNSVQYIKDQAHLDPEAADLLSPKEMALMDGSPKMRQVGERLNNRPSHLSRWQASSSITAHASTQSITLEVLL